MMTVLGHALLFPLALLTRNVANEDWTPYTSLETRVRFEMPTAPDEQIVNTDDGTQCRVYSCIQGDLIFQAVAVQMTDELQVALKEVVCEDEVSTTRQLLNDAVGGFLDATKGKIVDNDYVLFRKHPAQVASVSYGPRKAKVMAVVSDTYAYVFTVTYAENPLSQARAQRFFKSISLEP